MFLKCVNSSEEPKYDALWYLQFLQQLRTEGVPGQFTCPAWFYSHSSHFTAGLLALLQYPGCEKMTEKTAPWWRSFAGKRRKAARESAAMLEQELAAHAASPASTTSTSTLKESPTKPEQKVPPPQQKAQVGTTPSSEDTYDDSAIQPTFNEATNRRNLRVSRSGRFKEKRHMRVGLPQNYEDSPNPAGKGETHSPR